MIKLKISEDFTDSPGGRLITEGEDSAESFRDTILIEKLEEAIEKKEQLEINFDGGFGYLRSFLEESFGGLVREHDYTAKSLLDTIIFVSEDDDKLIERVKGYIKDAVNE